MKRVLIVAALAATGCLAAAAPASAGCYGTSGTVRVCESVNLVGGTLYEDCVYTGGSTCTPVSVPGPTGCVQASGDGWTTLPLCFR